MTDSHDETMSAFEDAGFYVLRQPEETDVAMVFTGGQQLCAVADIRSCVVTKRDYDFVPVDRIDAVTADLARRKQPTLFG